jgi:hypothetical protein
MTCFSVSRTLSSATGMAATPVMLMLLYGKITVREVYQPLGIAMRLADIPQQLQSRVARFRWDRIIEKHEGPEDWTYDFKDDYVDFLTIGGFDVLLPIDKENHANVTVERCIESKDGKTLTIFLHDRTYDSDSEMDMFAGRLAVCEKVPEQNWFIAIVYHECWVDRLEAHG